MSVSGISSSSLFDLLGTESAQEPEAAVTARDPTIREGFVGGKPLCRAIRFCDFAERCATSDRGSVGTTIRIAQAFQKLAQDLQSGNLSAAQQDFSTIQQDVQAQGGGHHHHSHGQDSSGAQQNPVAQLFSELGQALQSGNLTAAQQAYTAFSRTSNRRQAVRPHRILRRPQAECRRSRSHGRLRTKGTGYPVWIGESTGASTRVRVNRSAAYVYASVCFAARASLRKYAGGSWPVLSWDFDVLL